MRRLSLSLLIVVLLSTIGLGWAIDRLFVGLTEKSTDSLQLYHDFAGNLANVASNDGIERLQSMVQNWSGEAPMTPRLLTRRSLALPPALQQQLDNGDALTLESEHGISLLLALPAGEHVLALDVGETGIDARLRVFLTMLFYGGIVMLVLLWIYPLARRLHALTRSARAFGEGDFDKRVATHRFSYLRDIETEFNRMAQRIQHLVADNRLLASAVSHDLRTPLARLRFGIDMLDETSSDSDRAEYLVRISNDLTLMENLVEVLLEYARLDQQLSKLPDTRIDLAELVSNSVDAVASQASIRIDWQAPAAAQMVLAHPRYLSMLVNNLLQNAIDYAHSQARLQIRQHRAAIELIVEDDGPGIAKSLRKDVLKPFVRGEQQDKQRGHNGGMHKGYGMGLAIVSRIAEWHGAEFRIEQSDTLGGAQFVLRFKATKA